MDLIWIIMLIIIIVVSTWLKTRSIIQYGGEYVSYWQLGPENSQRLHPLGYLSDDGLIPPEGRLGVTRHTLPSRIHPHQAVNTSGQETRCPTGDYYVYRDTYDWKPYDWRPFEWRPYWQRRAHLCPSARNCEEYATDNCIGEGTSDYQSCYDAKQKKCMHK
jgi:hypothetical protein